jgi:hypothetical protein
MIIEHMEMILKGFREVSRRRWRIGLTPVWQRVRGDIGVSCWELPGHLTASDDSWAGEELGVCKVLMSKREG